MKTLNQLISFLLIFQLFAGCQSSESGAGPITKVNPPEAPTINISFEGTISSISNIIFPSAYAAEGVMIVNDYSNPDDPRELTRFDITNQNTFSFSLSRAQILGKLLKLHFVSSEGDEFSRQFLLTTNGTQDEIVAELSAETTARTFIVEGILKRKINEGSINLEDLAISFADHSSLDLAPLVQLIGHELFFKIMINPETQKSVTEAFVALMASKESGDINDSQKPLTYLSEISENIGLSKKIFLVCEGNQGRVSFNNGPHEVFAKGVQEYVIRKFSGTLNLGFANNWEEGNKIIIGLVELLSELSNNYGENLQAEIYFRSNTGEMASCRLNGKNIFESELVINPNPLQIVANFESLEALTYSEKLGLEEFQNEATSHFVASLQELKWLLEGAAIDPSEKMRILKNEYQRGFSILFPKVKSAAEKFYGDFEPLQELDITSFENVEKAGEATPNDIIYEWRLGMCRWYFGKFYL